MNTKKEIQCDSLLNCGEHALILLTHLKQNISQNNHCVLNKLITLDVEKVL